MKNTYEKEASVAEVNTIGLDIAKMSFKLTALMLRAIRFSADGSHEEKYWSFSQGSRSALWPWRLVAGRPTGLVS